MLKDDAVPMATLTSKGQTTIPKEVRDHLGLKPGDRIAFYLDKDRRVVLRAKNRDVMELAGMLHRPGMKPVSVEEMNEAIGKAIVGRYLRSQRK